MTIQQRVRSLIESRSREGLYLDWKEGLPQDRSEFLADVTSFANTGGGLLVYCVAEERVEGEKTGRPGEVTPVSEQEAQDAQERCVNWLADSVQPRIPVAHPHTIDASDVGASPGVVLVVEIRRSWTGPHMVSRGDSRWSMYKRNNYGKRPLDAAEIRSASVEVASIPDRIAELRRNGVGALLDSGILTGLDSAAVLLQLAPLGWWEEERTVDYASMQSLDLLDTLTGVANGRRLNIDGLMAWRADGGSANGDSAQTQFYRSARVDYSDAYPFLVAAPDSKESSFLASGVLRRALAKTLFQYRELVETAEVSEPIVVLLTLCNVKGFRLAIDPGGYARHRFDRDMVSVPAITVDHLDDITVDHLVVDLMTDVYRAAGEWEIPYKYAE